MKNNGFEKDLAKAIDFVEKIGQCKVTIDKDFGLIIADNKCWVTITWGDVINAYSSYDFGLELLSIYEYLSNSPFDEGK